jgi:hypothetical protein
MNLLNEYWEYLAVFFGGVLSSAMAISWFFYFMKWKSGRNKKHGSTPEYYYYSESNVDLKDEQKKLLNRNQELKIELESKRSLLKEKDDEIQELKRTLSESSPGRIVDLEIENDVVVSRFFSVPSKNGTFPVEKGIKKENDNTWYRIEYKRNEQVGKLFYLQGKADKRALNQMDLFLKPVCEFENMEISNPQKIQLLNPGKVTLKDGNWIIDKKLKLRLS